MHGPLTQQPDIGGRWIFPGRRLLMSGSWRDGLGEVWSHPWRVLHSTSVRVGGTVAQTVGAIRSSALVERALHAAEGAARERMTSAAAHAVCVWDVESASGAEVEIAWTADCSLPGEGEVSLRATPVPGGLRVTRADGAAVEFLVARGAALESAGLRMRARGRGGVRLVVVAGDDSADLARARERVERRGLGAIAGERVQHARLISDFGAAVELPDTAAVAAFEWAKVEADGLLYGLPGGEHRLAAAYRSPLSREWQRLGPLVPASGATLDALGGALLAAGLREPVREALRFAKSTALAVAYHAWTGEPAPAAPPDRALGALPDPAPGALPDPAPAGGSALTAAPAAAAGVWAPLAEEILGRWSARAAAGDALSLRAAVGDANEMAIRRLRIGATVLDAELRRRFDRVTVRLHRRHGPALPVTVEVDRPDPLEVSADEVAVPGHRAVVAVSDRHEVLFQF